MVSVPSRVCVVGWGRFRFWLPRWLVAGSRLQRHRRRRARTPPWWAIRLQNGRVGGGVVAAGRGAIPVGRVPAVWIPSRTLRTRTGGSLLMHLFLSSCRSCVCGREWVASHRCRLGISMIWFRVPAAGQSSSWVTTMWRTPAVLRWVRSGEQMQPRMAAPTRAASRSRCPVPVVAVGGSRDHPADVADRL
jgi:hypothetical protein